MADLAEYLKKKNAHIGGIGIQSHLKLLPMDEEVLEVNYINYYIPVIAPTIITIKKISNLEYKIIQVKMIDE